MVWKTEGPRVNFVMSEALFEIYTWISCLKTEKETSRIRSLYLYFIKIVPCCGYEISVFNTNKGGIQNSRLSRGPSHTWRERFHRRMNLKLFLMFTVAENAGIVNISGIHGGCGWPNRRRWLLPGTWSHLWFAGVREWPQWCSIVGATVTVHQFFCILHSFVFYI